MTKVFNVIFLFIIILLVLLGYYYFNTEYLLKTQPNLKVQIPEARSRRYGLIIDVRTLKERNNLGFYPNSIPISIHKLSTDVPMYLSNKNTHILVYSNGDNRAEQGANILYQMGYKNVRFIDDSYLSLLPGSSY